MKKTVRQLVRPEISALSAYPATVEKGYIKLDAMENPWPLPAELREELARRLADIPMNRYPDPSGDNLKDQLRQTFSIPEEASVLLGNGSDELITLITQSLARPGAKLLALEPSFVMYQKNAVFSGLDYVGVQLSSDFNLDLPRTLTTIAEHQPAIVFLSYPNNPTGNRFARTQVETICDLAAGLVVIDEAYHAFASDSFMNLAGARENLIIMRTLSKLGLAGIRLGYAAGPATWIDEFNKVRPPYNVNALTQEAACFSLRNIDIFQQQTEVLREERSRLAAGLARHTAIEPFSSDANFITIRVPNALDLYQNFKHKGLLIKQLHESHPLLENCLRLTIGTPEENDAILATLTNYFA